jgi:hypothetical protein
MPNTQMLEASIYEVDSRSPPLASVRMRNRVSANEQSPIDIGTSSSRQFIATNPQSIRLSGLRKFSLRILEAIQLAAEEGPDSSQLGVLQTCSVEDCPDLNRMSNMRQYSQSKKIVCIQRIASPPPGRIIFTLSSPALHGQKLAVTERRVCRHASPLVPKAHTRFVRL